MGNKVLWNILSQQYFFRKQSVQTVVSVYINTVKRTFLFKFWIITSFIYYKFKSKQRVARLLDSFSFMFIICCLKGWYKSKLKSNLHCINIYNEDCCIMLCLENQYHSISIFNIYQNRKCPINQKSSLMLYSGLFLIRVNSPLNITGCQRSVHPEP